MYSIPLFDMEQYLLFHKKTKYCQVVFTTGLILLIITHYKTP